MFPCLEPQVGTPRLEERCQCPNLKDPHDAHRHRRAQVQGALLPTVNAGTHGVDMSPRQMEGLAPVNVHAQAAVKVLGELDNRDASRGIVTMDDGRVSWMNMSGAMLQVWPGALRESKRRSRQPRRDRHRGHAPRYRDGNRHRTRRRLRRRLLQDAQNVMSTS